MFIDQSWIIFVLVFGAVLLAVQGAYWFIVKNRIEKKAINRRLELGAKLAPAEVLETLRRERGLAGPENAFPLAVNELLVQTGLRINPTRLIIWAVISAAALFFALRTFGFGVFVSLPMALGLALGGVYLFLVYARRKRIDRFGEQLPDSLDVIVRGLRAGHPFRVALGLVSREMQDPIGTEFGILFDEITFGLDANAAVDNLTRRVGHDDLSFFAVAINIQSQTGGNLAEILARLSKLVRDRAKLRLKVRSLTSEGRLSAVVLSLAPFILFFIITLLSPDYFLAVVDHPIVLPSLVVGLLMVGVGNFIMYRMVHFKV